MADKPSDRKQRQSQEPNRANKDHDFLVVGLGASAGGIQALKAMNEELRSSTEELETSKEELQSINEELITVNQELKIKVEELRQANNDFVNLMNSTDIGTIFLDRSLTVKMFTPRARDAFNLIPSDIGRPLLDITSRLVYDDLLEDIKQVMDSLQKLEREVQSVENRWYTLRILPYRISQDRIDGVVINLVDITKTIAKADLQEAHDKLESMVKARTLDLQNLTHSLRHEVAEKRQSEVARTKLMSQIVSVQEDERRRLARDLHDHLGQQLTALRLKLETLRSATGKRGQLQSEVDELLKITAQIDSDIDFLAWELRPVALDDLGLSEALRVYVNQWTVHYKVTSEFHSVGFDSLRPSREIENQLYRIGQEALNNVAKHAKASRVDVVLERRDNNVLLIVEDNGVGFLATEANPEDTLGISGMRERAALLGGCLEIESNANKGTTIFVNVPLLFEANRESAGNG